MKNRLIPGAAALVALGLTVGSVIAPTAADARPRDPRVRCGFDNDDPQCEETSGGSKRNEKGEYEVEITDWKNPPKNIPWSTIVTIKSPFETYKAVWDQDYKGKSCFISCDYYYGYTSRWTGESVSVAFSLMAPTAASIIKTSVMALKSTSTVNSLRCMATVMT